MIQRSLLRASQSVSTRLPARSFTSLRSAVPPFRPQTIPPLSSRIASRWYSDAPPAKEEPKTDEPAAAEPSEVEKLKKDLEAKDKEIKDLKDSYYRAIADYRNLTDRSKREQVSAREFALQKFAKDLIPAVDNLAHALNSVPETKLAAPEEANEVHKDLVGLHKGLQMAETVLLSTLEKHGLVRFDPSENAEKFDPNLHEATFMAPQPDKEDGTVFHTQQKGYSLNGRVLRAAQVGVVKNS
ncbi:hypothetical protein FKW77_002528 [Venturia effusa]|uniref:GrpE protein homolog n=1 Tax=Venturia effusa TaxID=50376 RepID=A0A517LDD6_9PEZI|nr:hypothetical protein FKW77_002528 [Venturia effusa]